MRILDVLWPFVSRKEHNVIVAALGEVKLNLEVEKSRLDHMAERLINKLTETGRLRRELEEVKEERDNWRKEASK